MSISNRVLKYGTHGAITYGSLYYLSGGANTVQAFGQSVPLPILGIGLGVAASVANDLAHNYILPLLPVDEKLKSLEGTAISLGSGAATTVGFAYLAQPALINEVGVAKLAAVGAASEVASEYIYQKLAGAMGYKPNELVW